MSDDNEKREKAENNEIIFGGKLKITTKSSFSFHINPDVSMPIKSVNIRGKKFSNNSKYFHLPAIFTVKILLFLNPARERDFDAFKRDHDQLKTEIGETKTQETPS